MPRSRRGVVPGLQSPFPLEHALPAVLMEEPEPVSGGGSTAPLVALPTGTYSMSIARGDLAEADSEAAELAGIWLLRLARAPSDQTGPYALELIHDGRTVAGGTLSLSGDAVSIRSSDCGAAEGRYMFQFDGASLAFEAVDDTCASRQALLAGRRWLRRSFATRLLWAFDDELAPIFAVLDNLDAYVDPRLAPADFVDWLSGWVGLSPNQKWPLRRRRDRIAEAVDLALSMGTSEGIKEVVSIFTGVEPSNVTIEENGGVAGSPTSGGELPGSPELKLGVRVAVPDPAAIDVELLGRVVSAAKPAHMPHQVEVVPG